MGAFLYIECSQNRERERAADPMAAARSVKMGIMPNAQESP